jgi:flagellum-specific peptidoglycan hydrolase FlgJ
MEQLVIFLLLVIGSIISSIIQNKKKKAEEQQQRELEELTRRPRGQAQSTPPRQAAQPPQASWPRTAADWQEQLRRMLEGETAPPVIIKPVLLPPQPTAQKPPIPVPPQKKPVAREVSEGDLVFKSPLHTSAASHERAANLHAAVEDRMRAIGEQRVKHTPANADRSRPRPHSAFVQRLKRNPRAIREAFIASIIFAPPQGLEQGATEPIR